MAQRLYPILLSLQQIDRVINLLRSQSAELNAAIDALNAPNVRDDARLYRSLTRQQDEIIEASLDE